MSSTVKAGGSSTGGLLGHIRTVLGEHPQGAVYRFLTDGEGEPLALANALLDRRARALAAVMRGRVPIGARAVIVCPPGLDYITAFLGCVYAGVIAVPVYPPDPVLLRRTLPRLLAILREAEPAVILAPAAVLGMAGMLNEHPSASQAWWLAVDTIDPAAADDWREPGTGADDIAFLQYTSGSTGRPKGVMVSHGNLQHNLAAINRLFVASDDDPRGVIWLPPYHDMGLIGGLLEPVYGGVPVTFMSPMAFLKRPERWLTAVSEHRGTISGGPNFAYDLCVAKVPPSRREGLDLSSWRLAFSGAERVRAETLQRFTEAYAPYGFRPEAFYPCYGLAEATLIATGGLRSARPVVRHVDADALARGTARPPEDEASARATVGCGTSLDGQQVLIADPQTLRRLPEGMVGEIWVRGPSVAQGYWRRPDESERTFGAMPLELDGGPSGDPGDRTQGYLRTGDLGFLDEGELFVTGRLKDVIIVAGANHYPDDIERSVERCHPAVRPGCGVASSYEEDGEERLVIVQEVLGDATTLEVPAVVEAIRAAVMQEHGLPVHDVALVRRGSVPKTSSGKLQRRACRDALLAGKLDCVARVVVTLRPATTLDAAGPQAGENVPAPAPAPAPALTATPQRGTREAIADAGLESRAAELERLLLRELAERLDLPADSLDPGRPFASYGLQSVDLVGLAGELERRLGRALPATLTWEYPTVQALAEHLANGTAQPRAVVVPGVTSRAGASPGEPIAVVGIGCRFPGGADGPDAYWRLLLDGRDAVTEVPADRWPVPADGGPLDGSRSGVPRWGGFVAGVDLFDPHFFGISAREAARMDPQQRLLAEVAWEALEDAGLPATSVAGTATGVFVGIATSDYGHLQFGDLGRIDAYTGTGNALSIAANRLSYLLDLRGPSLAVDTACSSSLVAVHQACQSLRSGESELALAGGVNVVLSPALGINFAEAGAMAADGRCKAFDARADGYVRSEGAGVVVLKSLSAALADGDRVYAVVLGGAVNQDGRTNGLMAPNPQAQEAVLRTAYARAGVSPSHVDYVEAHGTGTLLGDPIEAKALARVVGEGRDHGPCLIGSVKSNLGHLEAAAGIAGLIKTALMVHHRKVPASLHFEQPNPHIPFDEHHLEVVVRQRDWPQAERRAVAGVSSFGFGGTNAHLVVGAPAELPAPPRDPAPQSQTGVQTVAAQTVAAQPTLLTLSARDGSALRSLAERHDDQLGELKGNVDGALSDLAAAAALRRTAHEHRLTCVGQTPDDLREALRAFVNGQERPGLSAGVRRIGRRPRTVFVFAGQGARWWPLMGDPDRVFGPPGTAVLEQCEDLLRDQAGWSLRDQLTAPTDRSRLAEPEVGQPALCALQLALAATWRAWGVEPQAVVGHSVGEIAAAAVAGALTTADALRVALARGQAIRAAIGRGRMAVTALTADAALEWIGRCGLAGVAVAAVNGPRSTVLSGPEPELSRLSRELDEAGVFCRPLDAVDFASHGPQMDGPQADLVRRLDGLRPGRASLPMLSTVSGAVVDGEQLDAAYWAANLRNPVLFDVAVTALIGEGYDTFVELSGHPGLAAEVEQRLAAEQAPGAAVSSLRRDLPARATLLGELGRLWCAGYDLDWRRVYGPASRMVTLPTYPWQRTRHWLDDELGHRPAGSTGGHPVLDTHVRSAADPFAAHWTGTVDLRRLPYLRDHQVDTAPVLPAALLLDTALTAARRVTGDDATELEAVRLERMTVVDEAAPAATLQLVVFPESTGHGAFRIFTRRAGDAPDAARDGGWAAVASGRFAGPAGTGAASDAGAELDTARSRCPRTQDVEEHYARLAAVGLQYGTAFRAVAALQAGDGEAIGRLHERARLTADRDPYLIHPALLDGCLQVLAATVAGDAATYLPVEVGRFRLTAHGDAVRWVHATIDRPAAGSAGVEPAPDRLTGRLTLHDDGGRRVGELDGIVLQRLQAPAGDPVGDALLELAWTPVGASAAGPGPLDGAGRSAGRRWLLLADRTGLADGLRDRLSGRGEPCATVLPGTRFRRLDATRYAVRPDSPEDLTRVLAEVAPNGATSLHVVHAWALDAAPVNGAAEVTAEQATATYERICLPVLHLVQALAQRSSEAMTRLSLLTRGAQRTGVEPASAAGPEQTALWGLGRVIAMEHPELHPHMVDLDPRTEPGDLDTLLPELLRTDVPAQLALRDGTRLVPRLAPRRPEADIASRNDGQGSIAAQRIPFNPSVHGNHRILAGHPGILDSLAPARWRRVEPGPGQVEVEVRAAGLNFNDVLKALDVCPGVPPGRVPLGAECAGRVVAVGEGVTGLAVGDAVMAVAPSSLAAYATTDARLVSPRPEGLDDQQAAALPIAFLTAVYGLEYLARLRPGETVLIHAATGGVGLAALQVAHRNGARVIATAGSQRKRELLRTLGVDHVMDSRSLAFADQIRELTGGRGVDVVLNSLTGEALRRSLALLAPNGRFVEIGKQDVYADSHLGLSLLQRNRFLFAVDLELCLAEQPDLIAELLETVHAGFVEGAFTALPVTTFGYAEAGDAFAYMAQARHTGKIVLRPDGHETLPPSAASLVRGDATYLITGGLGGLGLCSAEHLVEAGARSVVLLGRHAPGPQAQAAVEGLRARGAQVLVRAADVARAGDVDAVLAEVDATLPPLAGIVHAAGVLDDALLQQQDADRFRTVAGPKVTGAWILHRATAGRDLDLFVLYSSAAALLGSPGQANYAAANGFLDGLARYRRARGLPALSIAWGPWSQVGLAARAGSDDALAAVGVNPINPADGTAALSRLLPGGPVDACVLPLDRTRLRVAAELGLLPQLLLGLVDPGAGGGTGPARTVAAQEIRRRLLEVEPGRRREVMLLQHCREEAARVLKLDPARVAPDEPLAGMGIDSLMALELRKRLETSLGITLPATVAWRFPTLQAMTPFLAEQMGIALHGDADAVSVSRAVAGGDGGPEPEQVDLAELEGLSDLDMEALLLAKLADLDEGRGA